MKDETAFLGIDIGWSPTRPTCGVAWRLPGASSELHVAHCRLRDLDAALAPLLSARGAHWDRMSVVIDGPVRAAASPAERRDLDGAFMRGGFVGHATSFSLATPSGRAFVDATEQALSVLARRVTVHRWLGGPLPEGVGAVIVETNPTISMALALPMVDRDRLPTRRQAVNIPGVGPVRAKSDFYWHVGASNLAAGMLGEPAVINERHHEHVAALWCLALAHSFAGAARDAGTVIALGHDGAVYLVPSTIDESWRDDVERVGVAWGRPTYAARAVRADLTEVPILLGNASDDSAEAGEDDEALRIEHDGGPMMLLLTDNGGVHASANPLLAGATFPLTGRLARSPTQRFEICARSSASAPHKIEPSALAIARSLGFSGSHLSKERPHAVEIEVDDDDTTR